MTAARAWCWIELISLVLIGACNQANNGGVAGDDGTADGAVGDSNPSCLTDSLMVTRIIDGDTIVLAMSPSETVRLVGIDTPELTPTPEPCAQAAKEFVLAQIGTDSAARVDLIYDSSCSADPLIQCRDIYDRLLGYVRLRNRNCDDLGALLLKAGLATVFRAFTFDRYAAYDDFERQAQVDGFGVHGAGCP